MCRGEALFDARARVLKASGDSTSGTGAEERRGRRGGSTVSPRPAGVVAGDAGGPSAEPAGLRLEVSWKLWVYAFGLAAFLGLFSLAVLHFGRLAAGEQLPLRNRLLVLVDWWTWALFAPLVVWLAQRFPIRGASKVRGLAFHLAAGTVVALSELAVYTVATGWYNRNVLAGEFWPFPQGFFVVSSLWFPYALLIYWIIVLAVHAVEYQRRFRERELAASELRGQLVSAQLQALRMQLHPHFLFNSLNTVVVFMREGRTEEAIEMQTRLADLLRQTLEREGRERVTLREELDFVAGYLEIEEIRFGDRLEVEIDVEEEALDSLLPVMLLQPLVENAMRHGIARKTGPGRIRIGGRRQAGRLVIEIEDDGPGFAAGRSGPGGRGVGLTNTLARLERSFGSDFDFETNAGTGGGARVRLSIPFSEARDAEVGAS